MKTFLFVCFIGKNNKEPGQQPQGQNPQQQGGQGPPGAARPPQASHQQQRPESSTSQGKQQKDEKPKPQQVQGPPAQQQQQRPGPAQTVEGEKKPPKGAWKDKQKKQGKGQNEGQSSAGQPKQQQQGQAEPSALKPMPLQQQQSQQQRPQGQHQQYQQRPQQQQQRPQGQPQQRPRSESVASQASQRSDRSGSQKAVVLSQGKPQKEDILAKMEKLSLVEASFPVRPSVSKDQNCRFKRELISTNYLSLNLKNLPDIVYHYDIKFDPDRPKKFLYPAFRVLIALHLPKLVNKVAFDGQNSFYSMEKIPTTQFPPISVPSPDAGRSKDFKVAIQLAATVDMKIIKQYPNYTNGTHMQQAIQVLDIVLRSAFDREGLIRFKRSIFAPPVQREFMKDNYEMYIGLFQSFVMGERPYLNVDVSHKAFPSGADNLEPLFRDYQNIHDILNGLNLVYTSPMTGEKKSFKYNGIRGPSDRETFTDEQDNNRRKTIAQYFQEKGRPLQKPQAPCIHIGPPTRNILIPMEFLSIPSGQALNRKAPESCTRDMVRIAATSTDKRKEKIMGLLRNINYKGG